MTLHIGAAVYAILLWWVGTGVVLSLVNRPRRTFRLSLAVASLAAIGALVALTLSAGQPTFLGAVVGFTAGLVIWGWHEIAFLTGFVTGPRKRDGEAGCGAWRNFLQASQTVIHHELALFATLLGLVALTWGQPNQVGLWTFAVLWAMRLSAKLNVFLGVRNLAEDWLPEHLGYLKTYFRKRRMNPLFPISIVGSATLLTMLVQHSAEITDVDGSRPVGLTLVATLVGLAILEHVLLMIPLGDTGLWRWASPKPSPSGSSSDWPR